VSLTKDRDKLIKIWQKHYGETPKVSAFCIFTWVGMTIHTYCKGLQNLMRGPNLGMGSALITKCDFTLFGRQCRLNKQSNSKGNEKKSQLKAMGNKLCLSSCISFLVFEEKASGII
jgi:hypothetical protein